MMKNDVLYIKYDNGSMTINMDVFFPCSKEALKKLLKVIDLDWAHDLELREKLKVYFQNKIPECQGLYEQNGKEYWKYTQLAADTKRMVAERKRPNGVPLSKEELKKERQRASQYRQKASECMMRAKKYERFRKRFQELLALV